MMKKATTPFERIYITCFSVPTDEDGICITFMAKDEFTGKLHPPVTCKEFKNIEDVVAIMVELFNAINANYDKRIYSPSTEYITDLPDDLNNIVKSMIAKRDRLISNPKLVKAVFLDVFGHMDTFFDE